MATATTPAQPAVPPQAGRVVGSGGLSGASIRHPTAPLVLFALLTVLGTCAWIRLPVQGMPAVEIPLVEIAVAQEGAAASDLERRVTRPVEDAVSGIAGVKRVVSTVSTGVSSTVVEFTLETDPELAANRVRDAVAEIRDRLPPGVREPLIQRIDVNASVLLTYAVVGDGRDASALSAFVDDHVVRDLRSLPGVAQVRREGGVTRELRVALDGGRLAAAGLDAPGVEAAIRQAVADAPGGRCVLPGQERLLRVAGSSGLANDRDLADLPLTLAGGRRMRLGDLGMVSSTVAPPTSIARSDGVEIVGFSILRTRAASEVVVADAVAEALEAIRVDHPWARFELVTDLVQPTRDSFHGAVTALVEGTLLTVLVVALFLRDLRATAIAAVTIPLSILPTFLVMHLLGYSLNGVSMLAIALVAGVLVDDAIVELENIARFQAQGIGPYRAALAATGHIGQAVVATSLVIVAVFLPVAFMPGIAGRFFVEFGITIAVAVLASLLVARTLTPVLAAYLLRDRPAQKPRPVHGRRWLLFAVRRPWTVTALGGASLVVGLVLAASLPTGFTAATERGQVDLEISMPVGTPLADADRRLAAVAAAVRALPGSAAVFTVAAVPRSTMSVRLATSGGPSTIAEAKAAIRAAAATVPDQRSAVLADNGTRDLRVGILGDGGPAHEFAAREFLAAVRRLPGLVGASIEGDPRPETVVLPRREALASLGLTPAGLAEILRLSTSGEDPARQVQIPVGGRLVPIRVQADARTAEDPAALAGLRIPLPGGGSVPLAAVAELRHGDGPAVITREQRQRQIVVAADLAPDSLIGSALEAVRDLPEWTHPPPGIRIAALGDAEILDELFTGFAGAASLGLLGAYLVLVLLYRDMIHPLAILAGLPLALGGAATALAVTGSALDLAALIGLLTLLGIVAKNGILVVDEAIQRMDAGELRRRAIVTAAATRTRPIIMTTLAMIAGMIPIVIGLAPDAAFRAPMAWAVIGGLISSTALSLLVTPALFLLADRMRCRLARITGAVVRMPTASERAS